jgi:hypothetical protein
MKNRVYLRRLYLSILVAFLLAYFPPDGWFVRFLCLIAFAIMAGWVQNAMLDSQGRLLPLKIHNLDRRRNGR